MKLFSFIPVAAALALSMAMPPTMTVVTGGDVIKCPDFSAVYYVGANNKRYVFPNDKTYFTWYSDFKNVRTVTCSELASITIGGNVTYRGGSKMIKIESDPRVYVIGRGGVLRHVGSESVAVALYGANWAKQVEDLPDSFFTNYTMGAQVMTASDFSRTLETSSAPNISEDKRIGQESATVDVSINSSGMFVPDNVVIQMGQRVRFTNSDDTTHRVASNPHPGHTDLSGFDSLENLTPGMSYMYTFNERGTFNYHDHLNPTVGATIIVQ